MKARVITAALTAALLLSAGISHAQYRHPKVFGAYVGANGVWLDNAAASMVSDVEGTLNARASLSPHISLVGSAGYGFINEYATAAAGLRVTATDVKDQTFSIGVGVQFRWYGKDYATKEWMPDVSLGWRPWADMSNLVIGGSGAYGLTSEGVRATLAARYRLY